MEFCPVKELSESIKRFPCISLHLPVPEKTTYLPLSVFSSHCMLFLPALIPRRERTLIDLLFNSVSLFSIKVITDF